MKARHALYLSLLLFGAMGCNSDNEMSPSVSIATKSSTKEIAMPGGGTLVLGASGIKSNPIHTGANARATTTSTEECQGDAAHTPHERLTITTVENKDVNVITMAKLFCSEFVEMRQNLKVDHPALANLTTDFNYISNGEPFQVMLLYTGTKSDTKLYIYYYDKDTNIFHMQQLWAMDSKWKQSNHFTDFQNLARINEDGKAWEICLPQGTEFGFMEEGYCTSSDSKYGGKTEYHFSRKEENLIHHPKTNYYLPDPIFPAAVQFTFAGEKYTGTFKGDKFELDCSQYEGKTFVGFENQFLEGGHTDYDYNDLIIMVTPAPEVKDYEKPGDIELIIGGTIEKDFTCKSDDTNIRTGADMVPISKIDNTTFELKLEKNEYFKIELRNMSQFEDYWTTDDANPNREWIVFDIRMYEYNVTFEEVKALFNIPEGETSRDIEGTSGKYSYKINIDIDNDSKKIHISPIIYRDKAE